MLCSSQCLMNFLSLELSERHCGRAAGTGTARDADLCNNFVVD
jgi:hypothetical protein